MKRFALGAVALLMAQGAMASSYVTGNVQFHDNKAFHGSSATSTLEAGHTFTNSLGGLTVYTEFDGIQIGDLEGDASSAYVTVGGEQSFNLTDNLWVAAGYQHLIQAGESIQYRPLVKIGYNFDNGIAISNRTRAHIDATDADNDTDYRMDNRIAYNLTDMEVGLSYNNIYMIDAEVMDHELRATWTRNGVQPYVEYRNQGDNDNNAFVFGASYGF
ncbi:porin [Photobacterium sanctipauli]|uniref:Porin n=1 Tax=Photobacterium sanctipauli TaxID=1342794 RepID=A0A2T3NGK9_9GAMM|nr:oligogalacturonate-specific porin KdgM family protein [Photobacterium sanctipauli]PSW13910.1 porin [Photobacterium sanctipauli]